MPECAQCATVISIAWMKIQQRSEFCGRCVRTGSTLESRARNSDQLIAECDEIIRVEESCEFEEEPRRGGYSDSIDDDSVFSDAFHHVAPDALPPQCAFLATAGDARDRRVDIAGKPETMDLCGGLM